MDYETLQRQNTNLQKTLLDVTYNYKLLQEQQEYLLMRLSTDEEIRDKTFRQVNIRDLASKYVREFVELKIAESKRGGRTKRRRRRRRKKSKKRRK